MQYTGTAALKPVENDTGSLEGSENSTRSVSVPVTASCAGDRQATPRRSADVDSLAASRLSDVEALKVSPRVSSDRSATQVSPRVSADRQVPRKSPRVSGNTPVTRVSPRTAGDPESLAARLAHVEVLVSELTGPAVVEQIDALRKSLSNECMERQSGHDALLKRLESLGSEVVAANISSAMMSKVMDEVRSVSVEQSAKMEVLKVQLESRIAECESEQTKNLLPQLPQTLQEMHGRMGSLQAHVDSEHTRLQGLAEQIEAMSKGVEGNGVSTEITEKLSDEISALRVEQSAKAEVLQLQLEARISECESVQAESLLHQLPHSLQELHGRCGALQAQLEAEHARLQSLSEQIESGTSGTVARLEGMIDVKLTEAQAKWKDALDEERMSSTARIQAMSKAIGGDLEKNVVTQAVSEARTEACTVACNVLAKELELWQTDKEDRCTRAELAQLAERVAVAEAVFKESVIADVAKEAKDLGDGARDIEVSSRIVNENCVRLESRLGALAAEVQAKTNALQAELTCVRTDLRKFSAVDVLGMQASVQKLLTQSDVVQRDLESLEKYRSEEASETGKRCLDKLQEHETQLANFKEEVVRRQDAEISIIALLKDVRRRQDEVPKKEPLPAMMHAKLQSIMSKLESNCIDSIGPDLNDVSSLLDMDLGHAESGRTSDMMFSGRSAATGARARSPSQPRQQSPWTKHARPSGQQTPRPSGQQSPRMPATQPSATPRKPVHDELISDPLLGGSENLKQDMLQCLRSELRHHIAESISLIQSHHSAPQRVAGAVSPAPPGLGQSLFGRQVSNEVPQGLPPASLDHSRASAGSHTQENPSLSAVRAPLLSERLSAPPLSERLTPVVGQTPRGVSVKVNPASTPITPSQHVQMRSEAASSGQSSRVASKDPSLSHSLHIPSKDVTLPPRGATGPTPLSPQMTNRSSHGAASVGASSPPLTGRALRGQSAASRQISADVSMLTRQAIVQGLEEAREAVEVGGLGPRATSPQRGPSVTTQPPQRGASITQRAGIRSYGGSTHVPPSTPGGVWR